MVSDWFVVDTFHSNVDDSVNSLRTNEGSWLYCNGRYKPHYPVPAIKVIRDVEIQYDRIIAWYRWPGGTWTYRYLYVK